MMDNLTSFWGLGEQAVITDMVTAKAGLPYRMVLPEQGSSFLHSF